MTVLNKLHRVYVVFKIFSLIFGPSLDLVVKILTQLGHFIFPQPYFLLLLLQSDLLFILHIQVVFFFFFPLSFALPPPPCLAYNIAGLQEYLLNESLFHHVSSTSFVSDVLCLQLRMSAIKRPTSLK